MRVKELDALSFPWDMLLSFILAARTANWLTWFLWERRDEGKKSKLLSSRRSESQKRLINRPTHATHYSLTATYCTEAKSYFVEMISIFQKTSYQEHPKPSKTRDNPGCLVPKNQVEVKTFLFPWVKRVPQVRVF